MLAVVGRFGTILVHFGHVSPFLAHLGRFWPFWGISGRFFAHFSPSFTIVGAASGPSGPSGALGSVLGPFSTIFDRFFTFFGPGWGISGRCWPLCCLPFFHHLSLWDNFWACGGPFGSFGAHLGFCSCLFGRLGRSGCVLWPIPGLLGSFSGVLGLFAALSARLGHFLEAKGQRRRHDVSGPPLSAAPLLER